MSEPEFTTEISSVEDGIVLIRGYSHGDIIGNIPYASAVFMTLVGRLPSEKEGRLVDAMLTSLLDHGFVASTVSAARYIASGNPEFIPAVAGGLLIASMLVFRHLGRIVFGWRPDLGEDSWRHAREGQGEPS